MEHFSHTLTHMTYLPLIWEHNYVTEESQNFTLQILFREHWGDISHLRRTAAGMPSDYNFTTTHCANSMVSMVRFLGQRCNRTPSMGKWFITTITNPPRPDDFSSKVSTSNAGLLDHIQYTWTFREEMTRLKPSYSTHNCIPSALCFKVDYRTRFIFFCKIDCQ